MPESLVVIVQSAVLFASSILIFRALGRRWLTGRTGWDRTAAIVIAFIAAGISVNLIELVPGILALATWISLMLLTNYLILKSKQFRDWVEGREIVVIQHGKIMEENLKHARMSPEDFLRLLRTKRVFQIADAEFAVLESDGEVNVLLKSERRPITPSDFGRPVSPAAAPQTVILDGNILDEGLSNLGLNRDWLQTELKKIGISAENVVIGQVDPSGDLYVDLFDDVLQIPPPSTRALLSAQLEQVEADLMTYELETEDQQAKEMYRRCISDIKSIRDELKPLLLP
ncbi:DUF421 domain-containing protein [Paenibacillus alkalitolerans]|uniref:DUF421 domain-containing protein n=1 Tax=Paenibacillus alkalitolerans TaxID=2799335 RepID=UPI0018F71E40|nr:DUF421 domain-containing protein [Paenibacillus alkalitolerans]